MGYGDIPLHIKQKLASERIRTYHAVWHFVRNESQWNDLEEEVKQQLRDEGWEPPRFETQDGAGIDFLYMHQRMIDMTNSWGNQDMHDHSHHGHGKKNFVVP